MNILPLVLPTVDAPHSKRLDTQRLVHCLRDPSLAEAACGRMSFLGNVKPQLQVAFAETFGITGAKLVAAANTFAKYSRQSYPLAA